MKISILTPNLSGNCAGRAWVLAELLKEEFAVEIIGPTLTGRVWAPLEAVEDIRFIAVPAHSKSWQFAKQAQRIREAASGEAVYVSKPLYSIMLPAICEKQENDKPFFLDIDDWQMGFQYRKLASPIGFCRVVTRELLGACGFDSFWNALLGERAIRKADAISVSNCYLQNRYGGTLIPHAREGSFLNPDQYSGDAARASLGLPFDRKIVAFIGSPRPHKGVQDLIEAVAQTQDDNVFLMLVGLGIDEYSKIIRRLGEKKLGKRFIVFDITPYTELPKFLSAADLVVIPQRKNPATVGQTPAKVFDAMAMGKPIIATAVGDLPAILDGCGELVPPEDIPALANKIVEVLSNEAEAALIAQKARTRFLEHYEMKPLRQKISKMILDGLDRKP